MLGMRRVVGMGRVFVRVLLVEPFVMTVTVAGAFVMSLVPGSFGRSGGSLDRCVNRSALPALRSWRDRGGDRRAHDR